MIFDTRGGDRLTDSGEQALVVRGLRRSLGLTQQGLADRLAELAWSTRRARVGVNADMVSKWERSQKRPSALYADLLTRLSGVAGVDLGAVSHAVIGHTSRDAAWWMRSVSSARWGRVSSYSMSSFSM